MSGDLYIWIVRWEDFQHYTPERDRAPAWIKTYTKQHDDDAYRKLTPHQRAVLHDLRIAFARARAKLASDTRDLSHRCGLRITSQQLESLNQAGLLEIISRETLEQRLDLLYRNSSPSARPRARVEVEVEPPQTPPQNGGAQIKLTQKDLRRYTGCKHTRGTHGQGYKHTPLGTDKPPPDWPHDKPTRDQILAALADQPIAF